MGTATAYGDGDGPVAIIVHLLVPQKPSDRIQLFFCEMKYLLKKETHNKNEENTLKELNKIF